jgi:hypothetical protein
LASFRPTKAQSVVKLFFAATCRDLPSKNLTLNRDPLHFENATLLAYSFTGNFLPHIRADSHAQVPSSDF